MEFIFGLLVGGVAVFTWCLLREHYGRNLRLYPIPVFSSWEATPRVRVIAPGEVFNWPSECYNERQIPGSFDNPLYHVFSAATGLWLTVRYHVPTPKLGFFHLPDGHKWTTTEVEAMEALIKKEIQVTDVAATTLAQLEQALLHKMQARPNAFFTVDAVRISSGPLLLPSL